MVFLILHCAAICLIVFLAVAASTNSDVDKLYRDRAEARRKWLEEEERQRRRQSS